MQIIIHHTLVLLWEKCHMAQRPGKSHLVVTLYEHVLICKMHYVEEKLWMSLSWEHTF